jgi:hypothetical protein
LGSDMVDLCVLVDVDDLALTPFMFTSSKEGEVGTRAEG